MKYRSFYLLSSATTLAVCAYPVYMGVVTLLAWMQNGVVTLADYKKYVIPYAPIGIALVITVLMMPFIYRLSSRFALPVSSAIGTALFFITEILLEKIPVSESLLPLQSWQYSLCIATPEVLRTIGAPLYAQGNPAFKYHFYLISLVIILASIHVVYGFTRMIKTDDRTKKRPLIAQLVSVAVFAGLCVLACFTAFYRNGTLQISSLSASLMSLFFVVFGVTAGAYAGCIFYRRHYILSVLLPALIAAGISLAMYAGELVLMGNVLFRYGTGAFFTPIGALPFAAVDYLVILLSGAITYLLMLLLNKKAIIQS
ncbi:MAG: hypothetical protein ACYCYM_07570 [Saccharofermentanales bacterium]